MKRNIVVPALDDYQRRELETLRNMEDCEFHSLLDSQRVVEAERIDFDALLEAARSELERLEGDVAGMLAHWDFPTSVLAPVLAQEYGLPAPSVTSVLKCEHKYWSRLEQSKSIPEFCCRFDTVDPFDENALANLSLPFPFWLKPVKAFSSQLGFKVETPEQFEEAIAETREHIHRFGDAFNQALARVDLPEQIQAAGGNTCVAEELLGGVQAAVEGSVFGGDVRVHGAFDMPKASGKEMVYGGLEYPSSLPRSIQERMIDASKRFLSHIGYDNGCFNAEFVWNEETGELKVIEFNTRISQSHSEMFVITDGVSNRKVALDIALGRPPTMPDQKGRYTHAANYIIPYHQDAIVRALPSKRAIETLESRFPGLQVRIDVEAGTRLSELPNQDPFFYHLGTIYIGGNGVKALREGYETVMDNLDFEMEAV